MTDWVQAEMARARQRYAFTEAQWASIEHLLRTDPRFDIAMAAKIIWGPVDGLEAMRKAFGVASQVEARRMTGTMTLSVGGDVVGVIFDQRPKLGGDGGEAVWRQASADRWRAQRGWRPAGGGAARKGRPHSRDRHGQLLPRRTT